MKKTFSVAAALGIALVIGGCGNADQSDSTEQSSTLSAAPSTAAPIELPSIGSTVTNGDAAISVLSVTSADSISFESDSLNGQYEQKPAPAGGKFVIVDSTVENVGKTSMDLTCNYPIVARVIDNEERQFDRIDYIFRVEGNPGCNKNLQPGFSAPMKWVYELPAGATPALFGFFTPGSQSIEEVKFIGLDQA